MKIGILTQNKETNITGINRVTIGLMTELLKIDRDNKYFFLGRTDWMDFDIESIPLVPDAGKEILLNYTLTSYPLDIVHSHYRPFHLNSNIPCGKILTIHDLIPLLYPEWYKSQYEYYDTAIRKSAEEADIIIAVSEYTKKDIIEHYGIGEDKVKVVYNGLYPSKLFSKDVKGSVLQELEGENFILSVSGVGPHKNQVGLVEAFLLYKSKHTDSDMKLVLTGPVRRYQVIRDIVGKHPDAASSVILTGFVSDEELAWLYKKSLAFIYVSYYEGFGIPVLEALSVGKAVVCSNTTSMPEVGGDAVAYCNPHEVESISDAISRVINDEKYRRELEKKAVIQAEKFSYLKSAKKLLEIYKTFES